MEQEDYLKRQIDQLGRVLGKILADLAGLKTGGSVSVGIDTTDLALKSGLNLDTGDLASIPEEKFIKTLQDGRQMSSDNFDKLAGVLFLVAEQLDNNKPGNEKKIKLYRRTLTIYEHLEKTSSTYSFDRHIKIDSVKNAITSLACHNL